jgi:predicted sulfurtransferase
MNFIKLDENFSQIEFKIDSCSEHLFDRLTIKVKKFLIKLGLEDHIDPTIDTGISTYISIHLYIYIILIVSFQSIISLLLYL